MEAYKSACSDRRHNAFQKSEMRLNYLELKLEFANLAD